VNVAAVCRRLDMSRENYYACRRQRQERKVDQDLIVSLVREQRQMHPRMGCRKLRHLLRQELKAAGVKVGRDRLFGILRDQGLLVEPKRGQPRTTNSRHNLPVFHNRVAEMTLTGPNQAWAADLTYVRTEEGFLYAAMITDMYSRMIVGSAVGDTLEAVGSLEALDGALAALPADQHPVHHSDRGCQFCCHLYVERLQERGLPVSMTEVLHCYENALAERVNGIIKQEYELDRTFRTKEQAIAAFRQAVWLYNHRRPHLALDYRTPAEVHAQAA
jgi:transposase InsO family protein